MGKTILILLVLALLLVSGCIQPPPSECGDGVCQPTERQSRSCPQDCKPRRETEACGPDNRGYCIDFREECKAGYRGIGPDKCSGGRSAECCVPGEVEEGMVGFVGCSITNNAVQGYLEIGGENFWDIDRETESYSGGSLVAWYNQAVEYTGHGYDYWGRFERLLNRYPNTKKVWWELCASPQTLDLEYENVLFVLNKIKEMAPDAEIYATPMPFFLDTTEGICVGNDGPLATKNFVDRMVLEGEVKAGPVLTDLGASQTQPDGCHANPAGRAIWGQDLMHFFDSGEPPEPVTPDVPYSFFVVHIKRGPESDYFGDFNNYLKPLVETADSYNVKLTLQFSPQWVDYILGNEDVENIVRSWQENGHEISIIHPGPSHLSWDGYSNMPEQDAINISYIRGTSPDDIHEFLGTMNDFLEMANELASPETIKSGTITNKWTDVPDIQYLTADGGGRNRKAVEQTWNGHTTYLLGIQGLWTAGMLEDAKNKYETLSEDEIFGGITHHHNFEGRGKEAIEGWFEYLYNEDPEGVKRKTLTGVMEEYVLPNNLTIDSDDACGDSFCDDTERRIDSCPADCAGCVFPSDCTWCTDKEDCPECANVGECKECGPGMRLCEQGTPGTFYNFVFGQ